MSKLHSAVPGGAGFFYLFDLPPTVFKPEVLQKLGNAMVTAIISGESLIESGYVYLAQFVSHDVSKRAPPPARHEFMPPGGLEQQRTPELDLDNVYGDGFYDARIAVDETTGKMLLGRVLDSNNLPGSQDDLPRGPGVKARIADDRDDENLLIAQLHVQFLKLHNRLVDRIRIKKPQFTPKQLFDEARRQLILIYQDVVLYDFLPTVLDLDVWRRVVLHKEHYLWRPVRAEMARMPVEFAAAAFRFAHAMVRPTYEISLGRFVDLRGLFEMTGAGGNDFGHQPGLPETHVVDWRFFFSGPCPAQKPPCHVNKGLRICPSVDVQSPAGSLAELDLGTGNRSLLASAQDIVAHIKVAHPTLPLDALNGQQLNPEVGNGNSEHVPLLSLLSDDKSDDMYDLSLKSPLWYYILCEAFAIRDRDQLGPLGSQIVAETLHALIYLGSISVLHEKLSELDIGIEPTGKVLDGQPHFRMIDLLQAAGPQSRKDEAPVSEQESPASSEAGDKLLKLQNVA